MSEAPAQQPWILQPLTEAGLTGDQVSTLVFRLAFDTAVDPVGPTPMDLHALAADQPLPVRRAWLEVLDRMTTGHTADLGETRRSRNEHVPDDVFPTRAPG